MGSINRALCVDPLRSIPVVWSYKITMSVTLSGCELPENHEILSNCHDIALMLTVRIPYDVWRSTVPYDDTFLLLLPQTLLTGVLTTVISPTKDVMFTSVFACLFVGRIISVHRS